MGSGPSTVPPGDERSRRVRSRRRPRRVGQAGRVRGRRRRDGGHARPPVPRGTLTGDMMMAEDVIGRDAPVGPACVPGAEDGVPCDIDELRTLFLFEALDDDQLQWLCEHGTVIHREPGYVYREGEPAMCF